MKILLIEDDEIFVENLSTHLIRRHYTVEAVGEAHQGWEYAQATKYDLIVLDINLPDLDGISLCQKLRKTHYEGAILLLTAKTDDLSKVSGLDAGADDYVIKSCTPEELCARIRALLRRPRELTATVLQWGELQLDPRTCQVSYGHQALSISPKEYGLLELFLRHPQQIFSSENLLERLWSFDETPGDETVRTHIKRLRRKLKRAGTSQVIENIYGIGYRLMAPPESDQEPPAPAARFAQVTTTTPQPSAGPLQSSQVEAKQAAIAALDKFRPILLERLTVLDEAVLAFESGAWSQTWQQDAYRAAHKLAGSLGLFGLPAGTHICQTLEAALQPEPDAGMEPLGPNFRQWVTQLHQAIDPALATASNLFSPQVSQPDSAIAETPLPLLLAISDNPDWLAEFAAIAAQTACQLSVMAPHQAPAQLAHSDPAVVLLDLTAPKSWQDGLLFLADLAQQRAARSILAITATADFPTRLAIARCGRHCLCLPQSTSSQQIIQQALEQYEQQATSTLHIVAVDDDPAILETLDHQLTSQGMQVTTLENPHRLWDTLLMTHPDLLLLDFEMPNVNGVELCQVIRSDRQWQHLPILFLSARRDAEVVQQMYQAGADDYIAKPFTPSDLITRIRNRMHRSRTLRI